MTDQVDPDDLATKSLKGLKKSDKAHERLVKRLRALALFEDGEYVPYKGAGVRIKPKAKRQGSDPPSVQLMIERRNRYEQCAEFIAKIHDMLKIAKTAAEIEELTRSLATFEKLADGHLSAIERAVVSVSKDVNNVQKVRQGLVTSAARMAQDDRHHQEKLAVSKNTDPSQMSEAQFLEIVNSDQATDGPHADA